MYAHRFAQIGVRLVSNIWYRGCRWSSEWLPKVILTTAELPRQHRDSDRKEGCTNNQDIFHGRLTDAGLFGLGMAIELRQQLLRALVIGFIFEVKDEHVEQNEIFPKTAE